MDGRGRAAGGVARREYVGAGGFEGDDGGFDGTAGRDGHVFREGIEIGGLPDGEDHGIGGDGAGLRLIKGRAERAGSVLDGKAGFDGEAGNGVRAFDAYRAPAALKIDALVAGVGDIVRIGGQFGFGLKGNHAHGRCSEALGGNRRIDGNVAAAHDHDMARKRRSVIAAHGTPGSSAPSMAILRLRLVPGARRNAL